MLKTMLNMAAGAIIAAAVGTAVAVVGTPPGTGFQTIDGLWLSGLAGGLNNTYQYGIATNGTNNATATQLPSGFALMEVDINSAVNQGVALPPCIQGTQFNLFNATTGSFAVYPSTISNTLNGVAIADTINGLSSLAGAGSATAHNLLEFSCARTGSWAAK